MLLRSQGAERLLGPSPDDDLGQLIRWSMRRTFGNSEPPDECWYHILCSVKQPRNRK